MAKATIKQMELLNAAIIRKLITRVEYDESILDSRKAYSIIGVAMMREKNVANGMNIKNITAQAFKKLDVIDYGSSSNRILFTSEWTDGLNSINCNEDMFI